MGDFLTAVKTVSLRPKSQPEKPVIQEVPVEKRPQVQTQHHEPATSPEEALRALRSHPDLNALKDVLSYLKRPSKAPDDFNIKIPSASSAKIINELILTTTPDFWDSIEEIRPLLLRIFRSVAGIGALLARLNVLISQHEANKKRLPNAEAAQPITELVAIFSSLFSGDDLALQIFEDISRFVENQTKRTLLWKEFLTSTASGKIVAAVAQAEDLFETTRGVDRGSWLSDGSKYSAWLGRNAASMARRAEGAGDKFIAKASAQLLGKSFSIGYPARVIDELHLNLTLSTTKIPSALNALTQQLQAHEQRQFLGLTMKFMIKRCASLQRSGAEDQSLSTPPQIAAAAALIRGMIDDNQPMKDHLISWLSDPNLSATEPFALRRAAISALAEEKHDNRIIVDDPMQDIMEKNMKLFGDSLFIKHAPILQQEACAQVLLLSAGYVHRAQPMFLFTLARSSIHLNATSNRLRSSSNRGRFLGMIVAMAISDIVDKTGSKMDFDVEDVKSPEARWYLQLVKLDDKAGSFRDMKDTFQQQSSSSASSARKLSPDAPRADTSSKPKKGIQQISSPSTQTSIQGPRIVEIMDDSEEDDDLVPYAKPDSDPEDEDEDPTLVNRNKPKPPVYIRDLIAGLNDSENHDRHTLSLKHAASLIRRKTSFGKEVSDHAIELAAILTGLGDTFETENFQELRMQALIAVLLSDPTQMAPWFASQAFDGDYSLSQRITVLSVLGLSARELAGYKNEDNEMNPALPSTSFPSKQLPDRLHKMYATDKQKTPLSRIASSLETAMIQPMALEAADSVSGPNILKVRTFSSRMEVEKKRKKAIPNALAKIVAENFFFPLTGRWWQNAQAYGSSNVHFQPFLLSTYLKTLAILLHASGPSTPSLLQMTSEFWDLLLGVRTNALGDISVLEATLFSLLTLLEVNEDKRRIAEDHSKQLIETQEWVELVFEKSSGADEEAERIRMLAASVLMKTREVVEKYQRLLVGSMMDY